jgi:hypothetical protein
MYRRSLSVFCRSLASLIAAGYLMIHPAVSPAVAALSTEQVNQFLADPSALLKANPNGGARLASQIRDLLFSDACQPAPVSPQLATCQQVLNAIVGLLANANDAQKAAIGTGGAEGAQGWVATNPTLANDIQTAFAKAGDKIALEAYQTTVGNTAIGAAGGGGANAAAYQTLTNTGGGGGGGLTQPPGVASAGAVIAGGSVPNNSSNTVTSQPVSNR